MGPNEVHSDIWEVSWQNGLVHKYAWSTKETFKGSFQHGCECNINTRKQWTWKKWRYAGNERKYEYHSSYIFGVIGENSVGTKQEQDAQKSTNYLTENCSIILLADHNNRKWKVVEEINSKIENSRNSSKSLSFIITITFRRNS